MPLDWVIVSVVAKTSALPLLAMRHLGTFLLCRHLGTLLMWSLGAFLNDYSG